MTSPVITTDGKFLVRPDGKVLTECPNLCNNLQITLSGFESPNNKFYSCPSPYDGNVGQFEIYGMDSFNGTYLINRTFSQSAQYCISSFETINNLNFRFYDGEELVQDSIDSNPKGIPISLLFIIEDAGFIRIASWASGTGFLSAYPLFIWFFDSAYNTNDLDIAVGNAIDNVLPSSDFTYSPYGIGFPRGSYSNIVHNRYPANFATSSDVYPVYSPFKYLFDGVQTNCVNLLPYGSGYGVNAMHGSGSILMEYA